MGRHTKEPNAVLSNTAADAVNDMPGTVGFCTACDVATMPGDPVCPRCGGTIVTPREVLAARRAKRDAA